MLASDEVDRVDVEAGSPPHAVVIASAGSASARADLTFCETPFGGAVFSTSCISWSLGLNRSERRNALSRITANVVDRFVDPEPFTPPQAASAE
ncbi:MAG: hypothetical protein GXX86_12340 [Propionibacterium sp.]|nr:hypothetical protein [Propionibacterium sp.]